MVRICKEESFHQRQGYDIMMKLCAGTPEQKAMAQDALNRWWWPALMMFGPPDAESVHSAQSMRWRIKMVTQRRAAPAFVDQTVPQAEYLGLTIPDPDLKWNDERGHYDFGEPSTGRSSTRSSRATVRATASACGARSKAWEDGAWVREASLRLRREAGRAPTPGDRAEKRAPDRTWRAIDVQRMAALGNLHPQPARLRTGTSAACTRRTPRWRSRTPATSTRAATKASASGR